MGAAVGKIINIKGYSVKIKKIVAEGGFSHVFLVKDVKTQEYYAMKRMVVDEGEHLDNAEAEIRTMESLPASRNLVRLLAWDVVDSGEMHEVLMLMEYMSGGSLVDIIKQRWDRPMTESEILKIFQTVCEAVAILHSCNPPIFHRDLKIENVLFDPKYGYKLCDFGSCTTKMIQQISSENRALIEDDIQRHTTPSYRAPEMIDLYSGFPITEKGDIWALGCLLYRIAYRKDAFESTLSVTGGVLAFPSRSDYSSDMERLIRLMLVRDPRKRPDVFTVLDAVSKVTHIPVTAKRGQTTPQRATQRMSLRKSVNFGPGGDGPVFLSQLDWTENSQGKLELDADDRLIEGETSAGTDLPIASSNSAIIGNVDLSPHPSPVRPTQRPTSPAALPTPTAASPAAAAPRFSQKPTQPPPAPPSRPAAQPVKPAKKAAPAPSQTVGGLFGQLHWYNDDDDVEEDGDEPVSAAIMGGARIRGAVHGGGNDDDDEADEHAGLRRGAASSSDEGDSNHTRTPASATATPRRPIGSAAAASAGTGSTGAFAFPTARLSDGQQAADSLSGRARRLAEGMLSKLSDAVHHMMSAPVEKWVTKATSEEDGPPKWKYVRRLVVYAWDVATAKEAGLDTQAGVHPSLQLVASLGRRPLHESPVVACKAVVMLLRLLQDGPHYVTEEIAQLESMLRALQSHYASHQPSRYGFVGDLIDLVLRKSAFLHTYVAFEGTYSLDTFLLNGGQLTGPGVAYSPEILSKLLTLQDSTMRLHQTLLALKDDPIMPSCSTALIRESFNLLLVSSHALVKLVLSQDGGRAAGLSPSLTASLQQLQDQTRRLHDVFEHYAMIADVMKLFPVPSIPDAPEFDGHSEPSVRPPPTSVNPHTLRKKLRRSEGGTDEYVEERTPWMESRSVSQQSLPQPVTPAQQQQQPGRPTGSAALKTITIKNPLQQQTPQRSLSGATTLPLPSVTGGAASARSAPTASTTTTGATAGTFFDFLSASPSVPSATHARSASDDLFEAVPSPRKSGADPFAAPSSGAAAQTAFDPFGSGGFDPFGASSGAFGASSAVGGDAFTAQGQDQQSLLFAQSQSQSQQYQSQEDGGQHGFASNFSDMFVTSFPDMPEPSA